MKKRLKKSGITLMTTVMLMPIATTITTVGFSVESYADNSAADHGIMRYKYFDLEGNELSSLSGYTFVRSEVKQYPLGTTDGWTYSYYSKNAKDVLIQWLDRDKG
ncbi:hypothetical protein EH331_14700, partial [Enterococcus faecalis]|nr:hypothetical protein [Enterococcus faecalis]